MVQGFTIDLGEVYAQGLGLPHTGSRLRRISPSLSGRVPTVASLRLRITEAGTQPVLLPPFSSSRSWFSILLKVYSCYL